MAEKLKEGMVLNYNTCDAFDPITHHEYNKHVEKELVLSIKNGRVNLYNLTTGQKHAIPNEEMDWFLKNKAFEITNEKA